MGQPAPADLEPQARPSGSLGDRGHGLVAAAPLLLAGIAIAEGVAIAARLGTGPHVVVELALIHVLALATVAVLCILARSSGADTTHLLLALIAGAAIGPVGILGAAALGLGSRRPAGPSPLIQQWYDRIALSITVPDEERLCEDVSVGRALDLGAPLPASFPAAMSAGTLADRQTILGHIARNFHPAYLETLKIALASPEPVIRVQAAAVAAHVAPRVRRLFEDRAGAAARGATDPLVALALLDDLEALLGSGLLDEAERQRGAALAARLGDTVLAGLERGPLVLPFATDVAHAAALDTRLERLLIGRGRFCELRTHRTALRLRARHPRARLRRLAARHPTVEAAQ